MMRYLIGATPTDNTAHTRPLTTDIGITAIIAWLLPILVLFPVSVAGFLSGGIPGMWEWYGGFLPELYGAQHPEAAAFAVLYGAAVVRAVSSRRRALVLSYITHSTLTSLTWFGWEAFVAGGIAATPVIGVIVAEQVASVADDELLGALETEGEQREMTRREFLTGGDDDA